MFLKVTRSIQNQETSLQSYDAIVQPKIWTTTNTEATNITATASNMTVMIKTAKKNFRKGSISYLWVLGTIICRKFLLNDGKVVGYGLHRRVLPVWLEAHQKNIRSQFAKSNTLQHIQAMHRSHWNRKHNYKFTTTRSKWSVKNLLQFELQS